MSVLHHPLRLSYVLPVRPRLIHGTRVWAEITDLCRAKGTRRAAIAFLGADAPRLLPLSRKSDVLVVNASKSALASGATNPDALAWYVDRGVRVLSSPKLHAKLVVTSQSVAVGSANASAHSTALDEAAIISDDAALIAGANDFIDNLDDTTVVDETFIKAARKLWKPPKGGGPPGAGDQGPDPPFLPLGKFRLRIQPSEPTKWTKREQDAIRTARRSLVRTAGPKATYNLSPYKQYDGPGALGQNDVLIDIMDHCLWPPSVVLGEPIKLSRSQSHIAMLRNRLDLSEVSIEHAEEQLKASGVRLSSGFFEPRWVTAPKTQKALLSIWALP
jgi:hypothetical protein